MIFHLHNAVLFHAARHSEPARNPYPDPLHIANPGQEKRPILGSGITLCMSVIVQHHAAVVNSECDCYIVLSALCSYGGGVQSAHRRSIGVQNPVEDANEQVGVAWVHNVLLQVRQKRHQLLRIPATCFRTHIPSYTDQGGLASRQAQCMVDASVQHSLKWNTSSPDVPGLAHSKEAITSQSNRWSCHNEGQLSCDALSNGDKALSQRQWQGSAPYQVRHPGRSGMPALPEGLPQSPLALSLAQHPRPPGTCTSPR